MWKNLTLSNKRKMLVTWWPRAQKAFPGGEEPTCPCRRSRRCECDPAVRKTPWWRQWQPTPAFLPGKPYKEGILVALVHEVTCKRVGHDLVTEQQLSRYLWARGHRPPGAQGLMPPAASPSANQRTVHRLITAPATCSLSSTWLYKKKYLFLIDQ